MSLSLVSGKLDFLHNGYVAAMENYHAPMVVKCTLFTTCVASQLLGTLVNMIFAMRIMSLLLGTYFNMKLYLKNFILKHYS